MMESHARKWQTMAENAVRILETVHAARNRDGVPADRTLAKICRSDRRFGSRDRQFFHLAVFAFYRWSGWLRHLPGNDLRTQLAAALLLESPDPMPPAGAFLAENCFPGTDLAGCTTPEMRFKALCGLDMTDTDLVPLWASQALAEGAERGFLPFLRTRSPLWVRVVPGAEAQAEAEWINAGLVFERHKTITNAYRFPNDRIRFDSMKLWKDGLMEMQDLSSQCIGLAAGVRPGEHWFDPCAGGGGKTLQLASLLRSSGSVTVHDIRSFKLDVLQERAGRTPFGSLIRRTEQFVPGTLFDGVLLDAPCSSSGRWRRDPDSRWLHTESPLPEITALQYDLLCKAAKSVKPGGKLIYGTCSVFAAENKELAQRFLSEHDKEFEPMLFTCPFTGRSVSMLQTFPGDGDCDGSFAAAFRRKNG